MQWSNQLVVCVYPWINQILIGDDDVAKRGKVEEASSQLEEERQGCI